MKVIKMIKDNSITGVEYGVVEVPDAEINTVSSDTAIKAAATAFQQAQQMRNKRIHKNNTKHK